MTVVPVAAALRAAPYRERCSAGRYGPSTNDADTSRWARKPHGAVPIGGVVGAADCISKSRGGIGVHQRHRTSGETTSGHPGPDTPRRMPRCHDDVIKRWG